MILESGRFRKRKRSIDFGVVEFKEEKREGAHRGSSPRLCKEVKISTIFIVLDLLT